MSASGSGSSDTVTSSRGKKRRKKRNKSEVVLANEVEPKTDESHPRKLKSASFSEGDTESLSSSSSSSSSDSDSDSESVILPPPLDGGWGWVVVIASFFAHFLCDGLSYNAGIIYEHLHKNFETGASETSWVSSIFLAVPYLLGPVAGAFTNRYGCRVAAVAGAVIGFVGCLLSYFVNTVAMLCITFGVIFGFGQALVLFSSTVIVPYYFNERRSLAYGLAVSGSGIGTAVLAPLIDMLMHEYGWRGCMLILSGLSLNLAVCGGLYRPLATREYKRRFRSKRNLQKFENLSRFSRESSLFIASTPPPISPSRVPDSDETTNVTETLLPKILDNKRHTDERWQTKDDDLNLVHAATNTNEHPSFAFTRSCDVVTFFSGDVAVPTNPSKGDALAPHDVNSVPVLANGERPKRRKQSKNPRQVRIVPIARLTPIAPLSRPDIFYRGSVLNQHQQPTSSKYDDLSDHRIRALSCPQLASREPRHQTWREAVREFFLEVGSTISRMASISIMRRPIFILFWLSNFLFYMWFEVPLNYIPEFTTKMTGSEYNYVPVIIIGLVTCVGQIVFGYLCDKPWVSSILLYGVGVIVTGVSTLFLPLVTSFWGLCLYVAIFTLGSCGNTALDTLILTEILGIKRLTNSYGLLMVGQGLASLFGAPIAGHIIDTHGSTLQGYNVCFLYTGSGLVVSGLMVAVIAPCVKTFRRWNPCRPDDDDEDDDDESKSTSDRLGSAHRDLETEGDLSCAPSPSQKRPCSANYVPTTSSSSKPGIIRLRGHGHHPHHHHPHIYHKAHFSGIYQRRSLSTTELFEFPPLANATPGLQPTVSVTKAKSEESSLLHNNDETAEICDDTTNQGVNENLVLGLEVTTEETECSADSTASVNESDSSGTTATTGTNHLTVTTATIPPTYAETAVGYAENPDGWADLLYKDRSLSVI